MPSPPCCNASTRCGPTVLPQPDPAWIPLLTADFVRSFPAVEVQRQRYLLDVFTSTIRTPEVIPLLEGVLDSWKPGDYYEAVHSAIQALDQIDPARAQALIRAELTKSANLAGCAAIRSAAALCRATDGR